MCTCRFGAPSGKGETEVNHLDSVGSVRSWFRCGICANHHVLSVLSCLILFLIRIPSLLHPVESVVLQNCLIIEGSLEVKLPTIWTDEKQSREEAERRERLEERRVRRKKMQMREKVGKSRNTVFFQ